MRQNLTEASRLYERGLQLLASPKGLYRAVKCLEKSYRLGSPFALYQLALIERSPNREFRVDLKHSDKLLIEARARLEKISESGEDAAAANHIIAQYYLQGFGGVLADDERWLHYEARAAELGSAEAAGELARYYREDEHLDEERASCYEERSHREAPPCAEQTAEASLLDEPVAAAPLIADIASAPIAVAERDVDLNLVAERDEVLTEDFAPLADVAALESTAPELDKPAELLEAKPADEQVYAAPQPEVSDLEESAAESAAVPAAPIYSAQYSFVPNRVPSLHGLDTVDKCYYPSELFLPRTRIVYVDARLSEEEQSDEYIADQKILRALRNLETEGRAKLDSSLALLREAAKVRPLTVDNILGDLYFRGDLLERDFTLALHYYKSAESAGSAYAAYQLGEIYLGAEDESLLDRDLGIRFIRKAATAGYAPALRRLGQLYHRGEISLVSYQAAYSFYQLAVDRGDRESLLEMAKIDEARGEDGLAAAHRAAYASQAASI